MPPSIERPKLGVTRPVHRPEYPKDYLPSQDRVIAALAEAAKDGVIDGHEALKMIDRFVGMMDEHTLRYGLRNVLTGQYKAFSPVRMPKNATLDEHARDLFEAVVFEDRDL